MVGIYKITNTINNKCYIGQSLNVEERWKEHICEGKILRRKTKFYLALNKYGADAFKFEVLEECSLDQEILDERERYWIEYYNSYKNGYNMTPGGRYESSWQYNPQEIRDLWDEGFSVKEIVEMVGCSDNLVRKRLQGYSDYNEHTSRSRAQQRAQYDYRTITIYQYDLSGKYVAEYKSMTDAAKALGHDSPSAICNALNHTSQTAFGYQWSREKVDSMPMVPVPMHHGGKLGRLGRLVRCINTNQIFHSLSEAAKWCDLKKCSNISECCTGKRKSAGKHPETGEKLTWEFV